jgi:activated CDC42 kinase 1
VQEKLGEGSFAVVKRALWTRPGEAKALAVAVKILRDGNNGDYAEELQQEISNMHQLRHPNLIRLYGIVLTKPTSMVVELCSGGALLDRLRVTDMERVLLATQLREYSAQVAKGMAYLESRRFIHRDLAARNILLTADERVCR